MIVQLSGQPSVNFSQYSEYVIIDPTVGRALFYYFTEAEREVDVVNCVSTRTNTTFLHKIHIQARDMKGLDVSVLQDKLRNTMK
ncbi:hypothetical protein ACS0TY_011272 [Phlomoides rotata]